MTAPRPRPVSAAVRPQGAEAGSRPASAEGATRPRTGASAWSSGERYESGASFDLRHLADLLAEAAEVARELAGKVEVQLAESAKTRLMNGVGTREENGSGTLPRLLSARQVGEILGFDAKTVRRWARKGRIPAGIEIGGVLRWRSEEIDALLRERSR